MIKDTAGFEYRPDKRGIAPQTFNYDFYIEAVKEFHQAFGHPVRAFPTLPDEETTNRRMSLIAEEAIELGEAMRTGKIEEIAKEAFDLLYVIFGTLLELGIHPHSFYIMQALQASNMSKTTTLSSALLEATHYEEKTGDACDVKPTGRENNYYIVRLRDGKIIKPRSYTPAEEMIKAVLSTDSTKFKK